MRNAESGIRTEQDRARPLPVPGVREATIPPASPLPAAQSPPEGSPPSKPSGPPLLLCQRVSKWYGPVIGVNQVTLELRQGITGLVGANGAGKSTLMRLITGQLRPDLGRVEVLGHDAWGARAKRHVGYCPEVDSFFEEMSGRQFVEVMARLCGYSRQEARRRAGAALDLVGMTGRAERRVRGYSKGMRQRVKLAQALLHDPELLVLDEPLSGIDPVGRWEFITLFRSLAEQGKCLLISSHELEELEKLTEHIAIMARGRIAAVGSVAQIRDRLDDHPLTVRLDIAQVVEDGHNGIAGPGPAHPQHRMRRGRELAAALLQLPDVVGVELLDDGSGSPGAEPDERARDASHKPDGQAREQRTERGISRVLVRARNPQRFFQDLARLVLEEWFEVLHLETLDESAQAVLGYLLGGR